MPQVINTTRWRPRLSAPSLQRAPFAMRSMLGQAPGAPPTPWFAWALMLGVGAALVYATMPPDRLPPRKRRVRANRRRTSRRRTSRRTRRNPKPKLSKAAIAFANELPWLPPQKGAAKKKLKAKIRTLLPPPTAAEIKKWNRDRGSDIMDALDDYRERTGVPYSAASTVLQYGWQDSKGKLKPNRTSRNSHARTSRAAHIARQEKQRDPADSSISTKKLKAELKKVDAEIDAAYWAFTRTARGQPPSIAVPSAYTRRNAIKAELAARARSGVRKNALRWPGWRRRGEGAVKAVSGGDISIMPYSSRQPDLQIVFFWLDGSQTDYGRTGADLATSKRIANAWYKAGVPGRRI